MIAVDSDILVYAHRGDAHWHDRAYACLAALADSQAPWAIPWPCIHGCLAIVTHPRIYALPTPLGKKIERIDAWPESPSVVLLCESEDHRLQLRPMFVAARVSGAQIHDAGVMALCKQHGVRELWTADSDFGRFPGSRVRNPLVS